MNLTLILEVIRNIVQIVFQLTASCVAVIGLSSWIVQLRGKTEYEVSKNVIAGAYRIRDEIKRCQHPLLNPDEWKERQPIEGETQEQRSAKEKWFALNKRYQKVISEINAWYPVRVEAEILFGEEARQVIDSLTICCIQLQEAIDKYHYGLYENRPFKETKTDFHIISGSPYSGDNNFQRNLDASIGGIETFFSQYIRAKKFTFPIQLHRSKLRSKEKVN
jgi:hypothetical protein